MRGSAVSFMVGNSTGQSLSRNLAAISPGLNRLIAHLTAPIETLMRPCFSCFAPRSIIPDGIAWSVSLS